MINLTASRQQLSHKYYESGHAAANKSDVIACIKMNADEENDDKGKKKSPKARVYKSGTEKREERNKRELKKIGADPKQRKLFDVRPFPKTSADVSFPSISSSASTSEQVNFLIMTSFNHFCTVFKTFRSSNS